MKLDPEGSLSAELLPWKGRRVLVAGGLGFIGSNLARSLTRAEAQVTVVDCLHPEYGGNRFNLAGTEEKVAIHLGDLRDTALMRELVRGQEVLFNLAGQTAHLDSMRDPQTDLEMNCRAQLSLLEACRHENRHVKVVFASTRQVYGVPLYLPVDEKHPLAPVDVNGANKLAGENYHIVYGRAYDLHVSVLRLTNTYGPRMRVKDERQTFLGVWLRRLLEGAPIRIFGDGSQRRDLNFVGDVVDALLCCAQDPMSRGRIFNLGSSEVVSLRELAELLVGLNGGGDIEIVEFPADRKAIDIGSYYSDYRSITEILGWQPRVKLLEGLRETLEFYRQNRVRYWE